MRPLTKELYGIPPERVVGTTVALKYKVENGVGNVYHKPEIEVFDDGPNKVVRIWSRIGARPILAADNSNGDIQTMEYTAPALWRRRTGLETDATKIVFIYKDGAHISARQFSVGYHRSRIDVERAG